MKKIVIIITLFLIYLLFLFIIKPKKNVESIMTAYVVNDVKNNNVKNEESCLSVESYLDNKLIFSDTTSCNNQKKKIRAIIKIENIENNLYIVNCTVIFGFSDSVTYQYRFSGDQGGIVCISKKQGSVS